MVFCLHHSSPTHLSRGLQHSSHDDDEAGGCQGGAHNIEAQLVKQVRTHSQACKGKAAPELALFHLLLQELLRVVARRNPLDTHVDLQAATQQAYVGMCDAHRHVSCPRRPSGHGCCAQQLLMAVVHFCGTCAHTTLQDGCGRTLWLSAAGSTR